MLDIDHKEGRRLLDPYENSKSPRLTEALGALGYTVTTGDIANVAGGHPDRVS
jgi:hypothetical protein